MRPHKRQITRFVRLKIAVESLLLLGLAAAAAPAAHAGSTPSATISSTREQEATQETLGNPGAARPPSATQKELASKFADAVKNRDALKLRALVAPKSLACFDQSRQPYLNDWLQRQFRFPVDESVPATVTTLAPNAVAKATGATFPVKPTDVLVLRSTRGGKNRMLRRLIAEQNGKWLIVIGCPTKETLERFGESERVKAKAAERADKLMPEVKEPLTAGVRKLLAKGDRTAAVRLCAETLKTDPLAASVVVDRIGGQDEVR